VVEVSTAPTDSVPTSHILRRTFAIPSLPSDSHSSRSCSPSSRSMCDCCPLHRPTPPFQGSHLKARPGFEGQRRYLSASRKAPSVRASEFFRFGRPNSSAAKPCLYLPGRTAGASAACSVDPSDRTRRVRMFPSLPSLPQRLGRQVLPECAVRLMAYQGASPRDWGRSKNDGSSVCSGGFGAVAR
jgi:hypothetical protein